MQSTKLLAATFAAILGSLPLADLADAEIKITRFEGTRTQVRAACASQGGSLIEGTDSRGMGYSACLKNNGVGVSCGDDGKCTGTGPRTTTLGTYQPGLSWQPSGGYEGHAGSGPKGAGLFRLQ